MGAAKELWMAEVERVGDDFAAEKITHDEAMAELRRLGFDHDESVEMLAAAVA